MFATSFLCRSDACTRAQKLPSTPYPNFIDMRRAFGTKISLWLFSYFFVCTIGHRLLRGLPGTMVVKKGGHHGDGKADRSTESDRTGRGSAHQRGATRHAREARRRPPPRHKDRCQATTASGCREPGRRAQHTTNCGTGQGAKDSRAPTPAHRTHSQREVGPGRTPERTSGRGWESARRPTPRQEAPPPARPRAAPTARESQLARARAVGSVSRRQQRE